MGYTEITFTLPTDYTDDQLRLKIQKKLQLAEFNFQIIQKSLDARKKNNIHWQVRILVTSENLKGEMPETTPLLKIPFKKREEKVIVVGSGPAGFFSGFVLQKAGFNVTIVERGTDVDKRSAGIKNFERNGAFSPISNYAFGEGGAGTFSDGKLTSRSKRISAEKQFILQSYVDAGAPPEILYLAHPHLGTNNLKKIVKNLRKQFINLGGTFLFENQLVDIKIKNNAATEIITDRSEVLETDYLLLATGHSAYETFRMLIEKGIQSRTKNFALGFRVEHPQELINTAQWGKPKLPGVKAAEYRLTSNADDKHPVYTFCMCPGGVVVPATAYEHANIVNGMSYYNRNGKFANAACVAGLHPDEILGDNTSPVKVLQWLEDLEQSFFKHSKYQAPACSIEDFLNFKSKGKLKESSYPLGLAAAELWRMIPEELSYSIKTGLKDFIRKIKGFETGMMMGLESKTSAPIQVLREESRNCVGFKNIYMVGEGSGYAGGIISSAADGIKAAIQIIEE